MCGKHSFCDDISVLSNCYNFCLISGTQCDIEGPCLAAPCIHGNCSQSLVEDVYVHICACESGQCYQGFHFLCTYFVFISLCCFVTTINFQHSSGRDDLLIYSSRKLSGITKLNIIIKHYGCPDNQYISYCWLVLDHQTLQISKWRNLGHQILEV